MSFQAAELTVADASEACAFALATEASARANAARAASTSLAATRPSADCASARFSVCVVSVKRGQRRLDGGLIRGQLRPGLCGLGLQLDGIDLGEDLALRDLLVVIDINVLDAPRHLGADFDGALRSERAGCRDGHPQIAARRLGRQVARNVTTPSAARHEADRDDRGDHDATGDQATTLLRLQPPTNARLAPDTERPCNVIRRGSRFSREPS